MAKIPAESGDWSPAEVALIVADYCDMLRAELDDEAFNKSEHRRALRTQLNGRSDGSVERKHQNISAVLVGMGLPYIDGYKPLGNYQALLETGVEDFFRAHPDFVARCERAQLVNPTVEQHPQRSWEELTEPPPEEIVGPERWTTPWMIRRPRRTDFARRDAENRQLGKLGEQFGLEVERRRLLEAGRNDLARKVDWVSQSVGDGLGFDLLSFDETDDSERFIEVKTTGLGKYFPFYVSENEVRCSEAEPGKYRLYRVFDFARAPRLYVLAGPLSAACRLTPVSYRATI
jgi:hypothetical protein